MSELRERVRKIALDVVHQVDGENVDSVAAGISFDVPMRINRHDVTVKFRCFLSDLKFELVGVFRDKETELEENENEPSIQQQVRRLNRLLEIGLRRSGFHDREQLRRNL